MAAADVNDTFIQRTITDFRRHTDEPETNAKYTETVLIGMIEQSYSTIISEINRNKKEPIVARYNITYVLAQETYILPPTIETIHAIYKMDTSSGSSGYKTFLDSRGQLNPRGRSVWQEGGILHIANNILSDGDVLTIEYVPNGTPRLHYGALTLDTAGVVANLSTQTLGTLDTRLNAYAGCILRIYHDADTSYNYIQERTIASYERTTKKATVDVAFSPNQGDGTHTGVTSYEIAPPISRGLDHVIGLYLAMWVAATETDKSRYYLIRNFYRDALRNLRLQAFYSNLQSCSSLRPDTYKSRRYRR